MAFWDSWFGRDKRAGQPGQTRAFQPLSSAGVFSRHGAGNTNPLRAMAEVPSLYRVVNKVSTSVSRAGWSAVRVQGADPRPLPARARAWANTLGGIESAEERQQALRRAIAAGQLVEVPNHPLLDLVQRGNPDFDATTTRYVIQMYLMLVGRVHVALNRGTTTNQPTSLQPFPPTAIDPSSSDTQTVFRLGRRTWSFPAKDVFTLSRPHPVDPYGQSLGMAQVLLGDLDIDESATTAVASRFRNGMMPDLLVQVEGLDDTGVDVMEAKLQDRHRGPGAVGKPLVTNAGRITVEPLSPTLVDMDVARLRGQQADIIRETPGIPPEIFGKVENSNRATAEAAHHLYGLHVVDPELHFLMRSLNHHLMGLFGDGVFLIYESPVPADRQFQLAVTEVHPGSFSENEKRSLASFPQQDSGWQIRGTSYTSGQIQQVWGISNQVGKGLIDRDAGIRMLTVLYNIAPEDAEIMVGPPDFVAAPATEPGLNQPDVNNPKEDPQEDEGEGDEEQAPGGNS